jgi:hypothetical protein
MADQIGLSMVVSSALPATFTFLYQHLDVLLSRRSGNTVGTSSPEVPGVPGLFTGEPKLPLRADEDRVSARAAELRAYALGLEHYQRDPSLIDSGDLLLMQALSGLRDALEDIYGQRFTFQGEDRGRPGPCSEQHHRKVGGEVVGMQAANVIRGPVTSKITVQSVEPGGRVVGMQARDIGESR